jgi:2-dehydro-3-deoxy-D-gluconate 5-dehydrogenase
MSDLFDIRGKKAIVTGGSRGIGKGIANGLHDAGVEVVVMGTNESVYASAKEIGASGTKAYGVICDFNETAAIAGAFQKAMEFLGDDIDILVNNAGTQIRHKCEEFPLEDWEKVLRINLTSAFVLSQLAGRIMLKKGSGKIINIASIMSFSGGYTVPAYAASKGAMAQMTKTFCNEWASRGVNVNAIAPGYIDTDNLIGLNETRMRQILDRIPAGRLGKPEDLVGMVIYLASKASDYVHGSVQLLDGGWQAR